MIQAKKIVPIMQQYMFTANNIMKGYKKIDKDNIAPAAAFLVPVAAAHAEPAALAPTAPTASLAPTAPLAENKIYTPKIKSIQTKPFIPFQKDKLFWCFYILLKGYDDYELNRSNSFSIEKKIKIETVEKLKNIKEKLKELKLKRTELEDNLVNQSTISIKGLYALCLVHNISITYVYGRKYCEINTTAESVPNNKKGILIQNDKKEDALSWNDTNDEFMQNIRKNYWFIENIQKPLKAPSAYTLKELQDICQKLNIDLNTTLNDKPKPKSKTKLYEDILICI